MQEAPTPETQNASAEPDDLGSLDAAAAAFATKEQSEEAAHPEEEAEPAHETEEETEQEAEEADPDEESESDELVEVEIEGKTYKVPPELQKGYLRQSDYSRKMNEVSEKEKAYSQRLEVAEKLYEGAEKFATALSRHHIQPAHIAR